MVFVCKHCTNCTIKQQQRVCFVGVAVPENGDDAAGTSRSIEVRQLGTSLLDESMQQVDLDISYQNATEQLQKLELQLSKRGEYEDL